MIRVSLGARLRRKKLRDSWYSVPAPNLQTGGGPDGGKKLKSQRVI
jgi:hypothetical protein